MKTCPDCNCDLQPVKILDATTVLRTSPAGFVELSYALPESKEGFLHKMPTLGKVKGWLCPQCNRMLLYGEPDLA